jgi:hypothetical protein
LITVLPNWATEFGPEWPKSAVFQVFMCLPQKGDFILVGGLWQTARVLVEPAPVRAGNVVRTPVVPVLLDAEKAGVWMCAPKEVLSQPGIGEEEKPATCGFLLRGPLDRT